LTRLFDLTTAGVVEDDRRLSFDLLPDVSSVGSRGGVRREAAC
jgi:hypothetical protein